MYVSHVISDVSMYAGMVLQTGLLNIAQSKAFIYLFIDLFIFYSYQSPLLRVFTNIRGDRGSTVVKVLCYKSEGRWFDPSWCQWNFSLI